MLFEWDATKAAANLAKHGVDFEMAKDVFLDPAGLTDLEDRGQGEERWRMIGIAAGKVLFVVYSEREGDVVRIISARKANKREERAYFGQAQA